MNSNMLVFFLFFFPFEPANGNRWVANSWHILSQKWSTNFFFFNVRHMPLLLLGLRAYHQLQVIWIDYPCFWLKRERPVLMWPFTPLPYMCKFCLFSTNVHAGWAPSQHQHSNSGGYNWAFPLAEIGLTWSWNLGCLETGWTHSSYL